MCSPSVGTAAWPTPTRGDGRDRRRACPACSRRPPRAAQPADRPLDAKGTPIVADEQLAWHGDRPERLIVREEPLEDPELDVDERVGARQHPLAQPEAEVLP